MEIKWLPEIKRLSNSPILLVGTKVDLREDETHLKTMNQKGQVAMTLEQGQALAKKLGAVGYVECSSLTQTGIESVFEEATLAAIKDEKMKENQRRFEEREANKCCRFMWNGDVKLNFYVAYF